MGSRDPADRNPILEDCQIRQQMKIQGGLDVKSLLISVVRKGRTDHDDEVVGKCKVDVWDPNSWEVLPHDLFDHRDIQTGAQLRLRVPQEPLQLLKAHANTATAD